MKHIHWYPGHIAKAQRQLKEKLNLVDVIIEVIDARIPYSSWYRNTQKLCPNKPRLILMNKSDIADDKRSKEWIECLKKLSGCEVLSTALNNKADINKIISKIIVLADDTMKKREEKGLLARSVRTMVIGMPNVGKSSTINKLTKSSKTKTGAKAGVTKQQQWVRINDKIELLDTPGIIPTTQDDQQQALKLACVNSIGENAYDSEYVAEELIKILVKLYPLELQKYYKFEQINDINPETIALKRNQLKKNGTADLKRASEVFLSCFRAGKIGKFTLETTEEYGLI